MVIIVNSSQVYEIISIKMPQKEIKKTKQTNLKKLHKFKNKTQDEKQISHIVHCNCSYSFKGQFKKPIKIGL